MKLQEQIMSPSFLTRPLCLALALALSACAVGPRYDAVRSLPRRAGPYRLFMCSPVF